MIIKGKEYIGSHNCNLDY